MVGKFHNEVVKTKAKSHQIFIRIQWFCRITVSARKIGFEQTVRVRVIRCQQDISTSWHHTIEEENSFEKNIDFKLWYINKNFIKTTSGNNNDKQCSINELFPFDKYINQFISIDINKECISFLFWFWFDERHRFLLILSDLSIFFLSRFNFLRCMVKIWFNTVGSDITYLWLSSHSHKWWTFHSNTVLVFHNLISIF